MSDTVSVIIPSALKAAPDGRHWLAKARASVAAQMLQPCEVIVGVDPGVTVPEFEENGYLPEMRFARGIIHGHQSATNAAAAQAKGTWLAFLEDDDTWEPDHLACLLTAAKEHGADFVSTSQIQIDTEGRYVLAPGNPVIISADAAVFHFPTASGWLIRRELWQALRWYHPTEGGDSGFDERFKIHHDNEFLGRLNGYTSLRIHLVRKDEPPHPWLDNVARHAKIIGCLDRMTVRRTVHEGSILADCRQDDAKGQRSAKEYAALEILYGEIPW